MFTPPDNRQNNEAEISEQASLEDIPEADIHTMPDKFLQSFAPPKPKGKTSWLILGGVIFLALGGVIFLAIMFLGRQKAEPVVSQEPLAPPLNLNQPSGNENLNQNQNQANPDSAGARDLQRLEDLAALRSALALYYQTYQIFPSSLSVLVGEFLQELPLNPEPGGLSYGYQAATDQLSYTITFALEEGGAWGAVKLAKGNYLLSPEGSVLPKTEAGESQLNANANVNGNQNTNSGLPQLPPNSALPPSKGLDSDNDDLTDIEENLYQTNPAQPDSDNDSYADAAEILGHYSPLKAGERLIDSGLIKVYQNSSYNYSLFYPSSWSARALTANNNEVVFASTTGEFIEIMVQPNPLALSALNWYLGQNKSADPASLKNLTVAGFPAVQSSDGLNTYLAVGSNLYVLSYNIGANQQMNFYTTYQLLLKSFIFIEPKAQ